MKFIYSLLAGMFVILTTTNCDDTVKPGDRIEFPSQNVSYAEHVQPLLNQRCTGSGCHNGTERAAGLSLTTWAETTSSSSIVFPGLPGNSILIWAIQGQGASLMPPVDAPVFPLNTNQIDGMIKWVEEGAKNN